MNIRSQTFTTDMDSYTVIYDSNEGGIQKPIVILTSYDILNILKESYASLPIEVKQRINQL